MGMCEVRGCSHRATEPVAESGATYRNLCAKHVIEFNTHRAEHPGDLAFAVWWRKANGLAPLEPQALNQTGEGHAHLDPYMMRAKAAMTSSGENLGCDSPGRGSSVPALYRAAATLSAWLGVTGRRKA